METKQAVEESRVSDKGEVVVGSSGDDARVLVEDHDEVDEDGDWEGITREFEKVDVVEKVDAITKMGTSGLATALQAAAIMIRLDRGWDWFMTLSASDYPLTTHDGDKLFLGRIPVDEKLVFWFVDQEFHPKDLETRNDPKLIKDRILEALKDYPAR